MAHTYNPSYSGSRNQKGHGSKPAQRPYLEKNPSQKRASGVAQGVGPEFNPSTGKKKIKPIIL
jgi:hypothetical protein